MTGPVREAGPGDRAAVAACVEAAFGVFTAQIGKPPAPLRADYAALIGRHRVHLIEHDGAVAGVLVTLPRPDHLLVEVVAVRPELQRRGLGRRLMAFAEDEARRQGQAEVRLYTHEVMHGARALYPALGYRETGRRVEDGYARIYFERRLPRVKDEVTIGR